MSKTPKVVYDLHAIQLEALKTVELRINVLREPADQIRLKKGEFSVKGGHQIDLESNTVAVRAQFEVGDESGEDDSFPFYVFVKVMGLFRVDTERFPQDKITWWAKTNSVHILWPYIREHVYGLTSRCGLPPVILPLIEVPSVKVVLPSSE